MTNANSNSLSPSESASQRRRARRNPSKPVSSKKSPSPRGYDDPEIEDTLATKALDRASLATLLESVREAQTENKNKSKHPSSGTSSPPAPVTPPNPFPSVPVHYSPAKVVPKAGDGPSDVPNSSPDPWKNPDSAFSPSGLSPVSPVHGQVASTELADPFVAADTSGEHIEGSGYELMAEVLKLSNSELAKFLGGEGQGAPVDSPLSAKSGKSRAVSELSYGTAASVKARSDEAKSKLSSGTAAPAKAGSNEGTSESSSGTGAVSSSDEADRETWEEVGASGLRSCKNG